MEVPVSPDADSMARPPLHTCWLCVVVIRKIQRRSRFRPVVWTTRS